MACHESCLCVPITEFPILLCSFFPMLLVVMGGGVGWLGGNSGGGIELGQAFNAAGEQGGVGVGRGLAGENARERWGEEAIGDGVWWCWEGVWVNVLQAP